MANWVKCNQATQGSSTEWDFTTGNIRYISLTLSNSTNFGATGSTTVMQNGKLKAFNLHVGTNTSSTDLLVRFSKSVWSGSGWSGEQLYLLFTVPAGETGYFCSSLTENQTDAIWSPRDRVSIRLQRSSGTGNIQNLTCGLCVEVTETGLTDTSGTNRTPS